MENIKLRGRLRFSTRDLLVTFTLLAVVFAWLGNDIQHTGHELSVVSKINELGAEVVYDVKKDGNYLSRDDDAASPSLVKRLIGAEGAHVNYVILNMHFMKTGDRNDNITDSCVADVATLSELRVLDLRGTAISDAGLEYLHTMPNLEQLMITGTRITDSGVRAFEQSNPNCEIVR